MKEQFNLGDYLPLLVKDVMIKPVLTIDSKKSVKDAGQILRKTRRDALIVIEKNKAVGILTDSDLIKKVVAKDLRSSKLKVKSVMSRPLVTVKPNETILDATRKMKRSNIKRLPVIEEGKLVGILNMNDIARNSPEMIDLLEYKLKMKEEEPVIREDTTSGICESCGIYSDELKNQGDQWICDQCREEVET